MDVSPPARPSLFPLSLLAILNTHVLLRSVVSGPGDLACALTQSGKLPIVFSWTDSSFLFSSFLGSLSQPPKPGKDTSLMCPQGTRKPSQLE